MSLMEPPICTCDAPAPSCHTVDAGGQEPSCPCDAELTSTPREELAAQLTNDGPKSGASSSVPYEQFSVDIEAEWGPTQCNYLLSLPQSAPTASSSSSSWPLLCVLTGQNEIRNVDTVKDWIFGSEAGLDSSVYEQFAVLVPLVSYECALCSDRRTINVDALWTLLITAIRRLGSTIDTQRVCITGYSMGADAALRLALRYGRHLSAIALFCGEFEYLVKELEDAGDEAAIQLEHLAIRAFHSASDTYIPASCTEKAFELLCTIWKKPVNQRSISFKDPKPPYFDPDAQVEFEVAECGSPDRSLWLFQDYVYKADDDWKGWRKARTHVMWPMIYLNEDTFRFFEWLQGHKAADGFTEDVLITEEEHGRENTSQLPDTKGGVTEDIADGCIGTPKRSKLSSSECTTATNQG